jgi:DNA-binding transcriptional ArsR family regulator
MVARRDRVRGKKASLLSATPVTLRSLALVFHLLSDELRLKIMLVLAQEEEMSVTELCQAFGQPQSVVSHHLRLMRLAKLLAYRRHGLENIYRVECSFLCDLAEQFFREVGSDDEVLRFNGCAIAYERST